MLYTPSIESSAMIVENPRGGRQENIEKKGDLWCTYCNKPRYTQEKCWKLHGKAHNREFGHKGGPSGVISQTWFGLCFY